MNKRILTLGVVLALVAVLVAPMAAFAADNEGTQNASTAQATTILIVSKPVSDNGTVTSITFPAGAPSATISVPYSNVDTGFPQVLGASGSEPVVQLKNSSAGTLTVWLSITSWTGGANRPVVSEQYELVATTVSNQETVAATLSTNGLAAAVNTGVTMLTNTYKALYLQVGLAALSGKTGTSTLSILGES